MYLYGLGLVTRAELQAGQTHNISCLAYRKLAPCQTYWSAVGKLFSPNLAEYDSERTVHNGLD